MIIEKITDLFGQTRVRWQLPNGDHVWWKFPFDPTNQQLLDQETKHLDSVQNSAVTKLEFPSVADNVDIIGKIVKQIKANPSLTLTQYNNYLATLHWSEAALIRYFIYVFGVALASRADINLSGITESNFLSQVRNYIVATPVRKLAKQIFGNEYVDV